jgi:hypothetical protein
MRQPFDWAYHVSTSILRLSVSRRDVVFKPAHAFSINVDCGIAITVVMDATGTCPCTIRQRQIGVDPTARATGFCGSEEAPDGHEVGIRPRCLIREHRTEHAPAGIKHALGRVAGQRYRHPAP